MAVHYPLHFVFTSLQRTLLPSSSRPGFYSSETATAYIVEGQFRVEGQKSEGHQLRESHPKDGVRGRRYVDHIGFEERNIRPRADPIYALVKAGRWW